MWRVPSTASLRGTWGSDKAFYLVCCSNTQPPQKSGNQGLCNWAGVRERDTL